MPIPQMILAALLGMTSPAAHAYSDPATWSIANQAGEKYGVAPALLVAIRVHENPRKSADHKACGVKDPTGRRRWYPGGLRGQLFKCADIVARYAKRHEWGGAHCPTKAQVRALGRFYAEGSTHWGAQVWSLYRSMAPTRVEVAR